MKKISLIFFAALVLIQSCKQADRYDEAQYTGWKTYAGSKDGIRYSSNDQINVQTVAGLQQAWTFSTHDSDTGNRSQNQCNPIIIDGILYGTSPRLKLFALDAATGAQKWLFDPSVEDTSMKNDRAASLKVCRGLIYWQDDAGKDRRVFYSVGSKTYAIGTADGRPIRSFGKGGWIDLLENLDRPGDSTAFMAANTPGVIYKDLLITGARVSESADAAPGHIRAFDVRTGTRRWIFHTIPHPSEYGYDTWPDKDAWKKLGGANNWAGMSLDEKRGILYVPTGTVSGDFYGGFRKGQNLFGNSLLALDAATGKYLWHFQTVHHDLWDRDLPANPNLVTITHEGKQIDAVAQISKQGYVFLFDRTNGQPVFPIEEKPVPQWALPGEEPWPTQPIPTLPEPFAKQTITESDVTNISPEAHEEMLQKFRQVKYSGLFTPPSKESSWIYPGFDGGGEWGGSAVDPQTGILYVNSNEMPWALTMIDVPKRSEDQSVQGQGLGVYNRYCIGCHGPERKGNGTSYPSLIGIGNKYHEDQLRSIIANGRNMMPSFRQMPETERTALVSFLISKPDPKKVPVGRAQTKKGDITVREPVSTQPAQKSILDEVLYTMTGYNRFVDKNGYPGVKPPWSTLNAIDLNSGKLLWKVPLGEFEELKQKGIPATGTQVYGGPVVTKGGLVFIASTQDEKIRAFDKKNGKMLWEAPLPAAGFATPAVYAVGGKEYVVIACGGGKVGNKSGDAWVAFALPGAAKQ